VPNWLTAVVSTGFVAAWFGLTAGAPDARAAIRELTAVSDAHVSSGREVGKAPILRLGGRPSRAALLRFSLGSIPLHPKSATLRVYKRSRAAVPVIVRSVHGPWSERSRRKRVRRPALGDRVAVIRAGRGARWIALDVSRVVPASGTVDLALQVPGRRRLVLASRESGGTAPRLLLEVDDGTDPSSATRALPAPLPTPGLPPLPDVPALPAPAPTPTPNPTSEAVRPYDAASPWNTPIGANPSLDPKSVIYMNAIADNNLPLTSDPDQYAIPVYRFDDSTPRVTVRLSGYFSSYDAGDNSRKGYGFAPTISGVPVPPNALQSEGSDGQIVIWDPVSGVEYSFWQFDRGLLGNYTATNGYRYHTSSGYHGRFADGNAGRGAGTPYFAGLVRKWEIGQGRIDHALAFAYDSPSGEFRYPASKSDGGSFGGITGIDLPEGARLQLDPSMTEADFDALGLSPAAKTIARAMQTYGMYVIDHSGSSKIYLEDRMTAGWGSNIDRDLVENIPWSRFRVVQAPAQP
jgi:hypothetical protein